MKDRASLYPGRVKLTPVSGQENTYDMVRADEPTQEGTPLSKATFLKDVTAALFGGDGTMLPDDVFRIIHEMFLESLSVETGTYEGTGGQTTINFSKTPKVVLINGYTYATRGSTTGNMSNMTIVMPHGIPAISFGDYYAGLNNTISLTWNGTSLSFNSDRMSRAGSTYQYAAF